MVCVAEGHKQSGKHVSNMQNLSPFSQEGNASSLALWLKPLSGDAYPVSFISSSRLEVVPARV